MTTHQPATATKHTMRSGLQMVAGLVLLGIGMALVIRAELGVAPWDVLNQGISKQLDISFGTANLGVGLLVLLLWVPLRQRPQFGTLVNVILVSVVIDGCLWLVPSFAWLPGQVLLIGLGIILAGVGTGLYIGSNWGAGPRDGLMTGLVAVTGRSIRLVRSCLELTAVGLGWLLGGTVGVGTVAFALAIGPLAHVFIPLFSPRRRLEE